MENRKYKFNESTAMQLSHALRGALREQSPLKLTVVKAARIMEGVNNHYLEAKDTVMRKIVVVDENGPVLRGDKKEGPEFITDFVLNVSDEVATKEFESISDSEIEVELPSITAETEVMLGGEKVTLEKFLDMDVSVSGNLAYVYLILTGDGQ